LQPELTAPAARPPEGGSPFRPVADAPPARPAAPRFLFIDALRGLAALSVVLFHAWEGRHVDELLAAMPAPARVPFHYGALGVQIFFVLSGFVIAHSMSRDPVDLRYVGRFMLRRSIRLDPPYWVSMALVVLFGLLSTRVIPGKVYALPTFGQIVAHMFYLPNLLRLPLINTIYWTLCLEIQFYLTFSLLMLLVVRLRRRGAGGWLAARAFSLVIVPAAAVADLWAYGAGPFNVLGLFVEQWYLFLAGVLVWAAVTRAEAGAHLVGFALADLAVLALAAIARRNLALGVGVSVAALILAAGRLGGLTTWLRARPFQVLGAISYSLYLTHNPITGAAFRIGYRFTGRSLATEALWLVLVVAVCIAFAWLYHRAIEGPSLSLSRRIRLR
jgi:peptidoglycan/LPS O-acetylase OafA/YrhL